MKRTLDRHSLKHLHEVWQVPIFVSFAERRVAARARVAAGVAALAIGAGILLVAVGSAAVGIAVLVVALATGLLVLRWR